MDTDKLLYKNETAELSENYRPESRAHHKFQTGQVEAGVNCIEIENYLGPSVFICGL